MSCRVATFARDPGPFTSCHVVTNAWDLELKDKDKCQKSRTNLAHPKPWEGDQTISFPGCGQGRPTP